eukprot:jgi/Mesen1/2041/ME000149S01035
MVLLLVKIKCDLENLTNLVPAADDFTFYFKLKCPSCGELSSKESSVTVGETLSLAKDKSGHKQHQPHPSSKGTGVANLVQKCNFCERSGTISIIDGYGKPYTAEDSEKGNFVPIVCLDCRGMQPEEFYPREGWAAVGVESNTPFREIDLSDGDYSDYDEKAALSVGVYNFKYEIVVTK